MTGDSAIDAAELVHLAESEAHRDWLKTTLGRDVDFGEEKTEESEQQPTPAKPKLGPALTRQMTVGAEIFLEEQIKRNEKEDRERAKLLALLAVGESAAEEGEVHPLPPRHARRRRLELR